MLSRDPDSCVACFELPSFAGVGIEGARNVGEGKEKSGEDTDPVEGGELRNGDNGRMSCLSMVVSGHNLSMLCPVRYHYISF